MYGCDVSMFDVFLMSASCVDDGTTGDYFIRRQILLHWHSWLHSREADRCQGKRLRDTADVRRCSTAPSENMINMSMFSN